MVNPENITKYDLSKDQLQEHILFWVCAAGKNGRTAARSLEKFLKSATGCVAGPFSVVRVIDKNQNLPEVMKSCGIGCYNGKAETFRQLANSKLNLKTCTAEDLEKIRGIGMKTSRCFILHSRYGARYAGLDTHILKYLKLAGVENVPKSTPSSKKEYLRLEKEFLKIADLNEMLPADFDLAIWNQYSVKSK